MLTSEDARFLNLRVTIDPVALGQARADAAKYEDEQNDADDDGTEEIGPDVVAKEDHDLIDDMIATGLVPSTAKSLALRTLTWPSYSSVPRPNYVFWRTFQCAGLGCTFAEQDGHCPADNTVMIRGYAAVSDGAFKPGAILQATKEVDSQEDYGDLDYPILVQFVVDGKLYRYRPKQLGFYPGTGDYVVNPLLAARGESRRLIQIDVQDLGGTVFANPIVLSAFCSKYNIHVYGHEEAPVSKVKSMLPIWDEFKGLMARRGQ